MHQELLKLIAEIARVEPSSIGPETDLLVEGLLDSLQVVELAGTLEQRYGLLLDPFDLTPENFASLTRIEALIGAKLAA